jgi:hypothetical protein
MQADAFSGFGRLYRADRQPGLVTEAGCWAHAAEASSNSPSCRRGRSPSRR